jgi:hypothetical protein
MVVKTTLEKDILKSAYKRLNDYSGYWLNNTQQNEFIFDLCSLVTNLCEEVQELQDKIEELSEKTDGD